MPVVPIPLFVAVVLGFLLIRSLIIGDRPWLFQALLAACMVQSIVITLNQHYGLSLFHPLQPVTASIVPPLAYLAFRTSALLPFRPAQDLLHAIAPAFVAFCVAFAPATLDPVVASVFIAYGAAMLWQMSAGRDTLVLARLDADGMPLLIWRAIAIALLLSAATDAVISLDQALSGGQWRPWIVSVFSSLTLLALGLLSLSREIGARGEERIAPAPDPAPIDEADQQIVDRLEHLLRTERLYLDADLTLGRLARRMHSPAKQVSAAINRVAGENVSRYVNRFRIAHAKARIAEGAAITAAMYESGFNTKSNFNREFLRIEGCSPRDWAARHGAPVLAGPAS